MPASGSSPGELQGNAGAAPATAIIEERNPLRSNIAASCECPADSIASWRKVPGFRCLGCGSWRNRIPYGIEISAPLGDPNAISFQGIGVCAGSVRVQHELAGATGFKTGSQTNGRENKTEPFQGAEF